MQLVSHLVDGGLDPQEAVSAPRTTVHPGSDADALGTPETLQCECRLGADVLAGLVARGTTSATWGTGAAVAARWSCRSTTSAGSSPVPPTRGRTAWRSVSEPSVTAVPPQGAYVPAVVHGGLAWTAGMTPRRARRAGRPGVVGRDLDIAAAREAAGLAADNALTAARRGGRGLDGIVRCLKMTVFIAAVDGFTAHSAVADGASRCCASGWGSGARSPAARRRRHAARRARRSRWNWSPPSDRLNRAHD